MIGHEIAAALPELRRQAESLMTDTCTITSTDPDAQPVFDEETGTYTQPSATRYEGKCRVRSGRSQGTEREAGDSFTIANRVTVSLPFGNSGFSTSDRVTITASLNPQLVGAVYVVRAVDDQSQPTALRLECEEA